MAYTETYGNGESGQGLIPWRSDLLPSSSPAVQVTRQSLSIKSGYGRQSH